MLNLRPTAATWFEILIAKEDLEIALECLAQQQLVELENHDDFHPHLKLPELQSKLQQVYHVLKSYAIYLPRAHIHPEKKNAIVAIESAIEKINDWRKTADPLIELLEHERAKLIEVKQLEKMLTVFPLNQIPLQQLASKGLILEPVFYALPKHIDLDIDNTVFSIPFSSDTGNYLFLMGRKNDLHPTILQLDSLHAHAIKLPDYIRGNRTEVLRLLRSKYHHLSWVCATLRAKLADLCYQYELAYCLGDLQRMSWFSQLAKDFPISEQFSWISGWTISKTEAKLESVLKQFNIRGLVYMNKQPNELKAPSIINNPKWVRPFEIFPKLLGMPGTNEADPSKLLFIFVPLLFGYMFADVGQGAVLMIAGLLLQGRWPVLKILIINGASSIFFGFLFSSVFTYEHLFPPLWLHPMQHPMIILLVPIVFGASLLCLGQALSGISAYWQGLLFQWWKREGLILFLYLTILTSFLHPKLIYGILPLLIIFIVANSTSIKNLFASLAKGLEDLIQLLVNTLSFARVGAFALAHGGLGIALVSIADSSGNIFLAGIIMILGNIIIIVLESLVVSIQTTRLILFEFFIRFFRAQGRRFKPLLGPQSEDILTPLKEKEDRHEYAS